MKNRKKIVFLVKLLLGVVLIFLILRQVRIKESLNLLSTSNLYYLILVAIIVNMDRFFMAFKWGILIRIKKLLCPFVWLLKGYYITSVLGTILPSTVGGDFVRGYIISKSGVDSENIISSIIMERILATMSLAFLVIASLGIFASIENRPVINIFFYLIALLLAVSLALVVSLSNRMSSIIENNDRLKKGGKISAFIYTIFIRYSEYRAYRKSLVLFFLLSLIENSIPIVNIYLIAKSLSMDVTLISMFYTVPTMTLLSRIPITIGGLGVQEGAFIMFLSLVGLSLTDAFTISILARIVCLFSVMPIFIYLIRGKKYKQFVTLTTV